MVLYHWKLGGEIACYPKRTKFEGNLLTVDGDSKSTVYESLLQLLTLEGQWVFDPLCEQGRKVSI